MTVPAHRRQQRGRVDCREVEPFGEDPAWAGAGKGSTARLYFFCFYAPHYGSCPIELVVEKGGWMSIFGSAHVVIPVVRKCDPPRASYLFLSFMDVSDWLCFQSVIWQSATLPHRSHARCSAQQRSGHTIFYAPTLTFAVAHCVASVFWTFPSSHPPSRPLFTVRTPLFLSHPKQAHASPGNRRTGGEGALWLRSVGSERGVKSAPSGRTLRSQMRTRLGGFLGVIFKKWPFLAFFLLFTGQKFDF